MNTTNSQKAINDYIGEVIYSTNEMVIAQCYKEETTRTFKNSVIQGSIVKVVSSYDNSYVAYGIVSKINNSSLDNIHKPSALGLSFKQLEELQPQVYDLLKKELEIYLFAHSQSDGQILSHTPQKPMMIHDFVGKTSDKEITELTNNFSNLINLIKRVGLKPELLLGPIAYSYKLRSYNDNYLINVGKELSLAFSDEVESLIHLLKWLSQNKEKTKVSS